jgi:tRNA(adenine34) deaminase
MSFSNSDKKYMKLALKEAKLAYKSNDFPVGAVLVINDKYIGKARNYSHTKNNWASHAESMLIKRHATKIKKAFLDCEKKGIKPKIELYTTLDPCLMCLGKIIMNKITRVIVGSIDPVRGTIHLNPKALGRAYLKGWPKIDQGLYEKECFKLLYNQIKSHSNYDNYFKDYEKEKRRLKL